MAGLISNLMLLTIQFIILDCTERTLKLVYKPYGPKMCSQLCEDLDDYLFYLPENLSCHRVPTKYPSVFIKESFKFCLMDDISRNHATAVPLKTGLYACNKHNEDALKSTLQHPTTKATSGRDLHSGHVGHNMSLHQACEEGLLCTVQFILTKRPDDINARDKMGKTPVMVAVMEDKINIFNLLVNQSCDIMALDNNNDSVLHVACRVGNVDIVRKLVVYHTCNIESRGRKGMTPVMCSAQHGHRDVFDLLVAKGCNVSVLDDSLNNILHVACSDMVKYVLRKLSSHIESRGEKGRTPVMIAAHSGHAEVFDFLASNGSNLFAIDDNKDNILHAACIGGHVDMVQHIFNKMAINLESRGKYGRTPVMRAAEYGQRSVVDFLASKDCNLKAIDNKTGTLLHVACAGGHVGMVKHLLLKMKLPIDSRGQDGQTPVMTAVRHGHKDVLKILLSNKCNMALLNNYGNNILHIACGCGRNIIVRYILSYTNISIDSGGQYGRTPAMIAAYFGCESIFIFLVGQGCNLMILDNDKNSILHVACMGGHVDIVKHIVEKQKMEINIRGHFGRTPVMTAARYGHMSVVKYLISKGCKLPQEDIQSNNILHLGCMSGNVDLIRYIISQTEVGVDSRGQNRWTPVMTAASKAHTAVVKYLISKGCELSIVDIHGNNILHVACKSGNIDLVKCILSQTKVGVDSREQNRRTPVMTAASYGHVSVVKYLIRKGCKLSIVDIHGNNILHVACLSGSVDLVKYILSQTTFGVESRGQYGRTPVMTAASKGHTSVVKYLMSIGCNLSVVSPNGNNILHMACMSGDVELVKYILSQTNLGVDRRGLYGRTPVMAAAYFGHTAVVKQIMSIGYKLSMVDTSGNNILHVACMSGDVEMVKYILSQNKFGVDSRGQYGRTPVMAAAYFGHTSVIRYLVRKGCKLTIVDERGTNVLELACMGHHGDVVKYLIRIKSWPKTC